MNRPEWRWDFSGPDGTAPARPVSPAFTARFDAEEWLGDNWRDLAGHGVANAILRRGDEPVGAPVPLVGTGIPSEPAAPGPDAP